MLNVIHENPYILIAGIIFVGLLSYYIYRIIKSLYGFYKIAKFEYNQKYEKDPRKLFINSCEFCFGKIKHIYPNAIVLVELKESENDAMEWIYDISLWETKRTIAIQVKCPKRAIVANDRGILINKDVYIFESGAALWY